MNLKLDIFKEPKLSFTLKKLSKFNNRYLEIEFEEELNLSENDLLWADKDREKNDFTQMIIVSAMIKPGKFLVSRPELESVNGLRIFDKKEVFRHIASFKPEQDGS